MVFGRVLGIQWRNGWCLEEWGNVMETWLLFGTVLWDTMEIWLVFGTGGRYKGDMAGGWKSGGYNGELGDLTSIISIKFDFHRMIDIG